MALAAARGIVPSATIRLRDLRKRRGMYASNTVADAEIERIVGALRGRERDIFLQIDVLGKPVKQVAGDLGVSIRHLYRLRRQLVKRLDAQVEDALSVPVPSAFEEQFEAAHIAFEHGDAQRASCVLEPLLRSELSPASAARAWALKCRIDIDRGQFAAAHGSLNEARKFMHAAPLDVALAESYTAYSRGAYADAIDVAQQACRDVCVNHGSAELRDVVRAYLYLATIHQENGTLQGAATALDEAEAYLRMLRVPPAHERVQLSIVRATVLSAQAEHIGAAMAHASEALQTARWHGLTTDAIWAAYTKAYILLGAGNAQAAAPLAKAAVENARDSIRGHHLARMCLMMARIEIAADRLPEAQKWIEKAKKTGKMHGRSLAIAAACETRLFRRMADTRAAIDNTRRCLQSFDACNESYHKGVAYLALAHSEAKAGRRAADDSDRALHYLRRGGMLCDRIDALELGYRITNKRECLNEAQHLRNVLARYLTVQA